MCIVATPKTTEEYTRESWVPPRRATGYKQKHGRHGESYSYHDSHGRLATDLPSSRRSSHHSHHSHHSHRSHRSHRSHSGSFSSHPHRAPAPVVVVARGHQHTYPTTTTTSSSRLGPTHAYAGGGDVSPRTSARRVALLPLPPQPQPQVVGHQSRRLSAGKAGWGGWRRESITDRDRERVVVY